MLKLADMSDGEIIARVDHIAGALLMAATVAVERDDEAWMERHAWFGEPSSSCSPIRPPCHSTARACARKVQIAG
jgi:hypothetical protein